MQKRLIVGGIDEEKQCGKKEKLQKRRQKGNN